ncbi:MAG TPA: hypothetical protein VKZ59_01075 [Acidobacteriota bacterium]|nr:hypothetical protein [Acidobacteriota bacterium]
MARGKAVWAATIRLSVRRKRPSINYLILYLNSLDPTTRWYKIRVTFCRPQDRVDPCEHEFDLLEFGSDRPCCAF